MEGWRRLGLTLDEDERMQEAAGLSEGLRLSNNAV